MNLTHGEIAKKVTSSTINGPSIPVAQLVRLVTRT